MNTVAARRRPQRLLRDIIDLILMGNCLQAGVYRVDITPPIGISMCGYFARAGVSNSLERPLTATATVFASGGNKIAILGCDLISILNPVVDEIRADWKVEHTPSLPKGRCA